MNKQDLDLINSMLSRIGDGVLEALEILQDENKKHKNARIEAEKILDELLIKIPVFMEVKK